MKRNRIFLNLISLLLIITINGQPKELPFCGEEAVIPVSLDIISIDKKRTRELKNYVKDAVEYKKEMSAFIESKYFKQKYEIEDRFMPVRLIKPEKE